MGLPAKLAFLFPNADPEVDYTVEDDGHGPRIRTWRLSVPKPQDDELSALDSDPRFRAFMEKRARKARGKQIARRIRESFSESEELAILRRQIGAILVEAAISPTEEFAEYLGVVAGAEGEN